MEESSADPGGYDYKFVDRIPDVFICNICYLPSRDPYLTVCCGHVFCSSCLNNGVTVIRVCPMCRSKKFTTFPNKQTDREVKNLRVLCPNKKKGCDWVGELRAVSDHLERSAEGCKYVCVICRNGCGKKIQRKNLMHHLLVSCPCREEECKHCCMIGGHQYITGRHKKFCPKLPLPCPNKCKGDKINREDMLEHRKSCPLEMVCCKYGCGIKFARKDQEKHDQEKMQDHLAVTKTELATTKDRVNVLEALLFHYVKKKQLDGSCDANPVNSGWSIQLHLASLTASTSPASPVVVKMKEYNKMKKRKKRWYSDNIYTHSRGYRLCMYVYPAGKNEGEDTHLSVYLCLMEGLYDEQLTWPFKDEVEISLLNQIGDNQHISETVSFVDCDDDIVGRVTGDKVSKGYGHSMFVSNEILLTCTSTCQYLKDDCLYLKVNCISSTLV